MPETPDPLHLVLLDFADTSRAPEHMAAHNRWIDEGFDSGGFLLAGSVPGRGGAVLIAGADEQQVAAQVAADPFVRHGVVTSQVLQIAPSRIADALRDASSAATS